VTPIRRHADRRRERGSRTDAGPKQPDTFPTFTTKPVGHAIEPDVSLSSCSARSPQDTPMLSPRPRCTGADKDPTTCGAHVASPHIGRSTSRTPLLRSVAVHQALFARLIKRYPIGRHCGSCLGILWPSSRPWSKLTVYNFSVSPPKHAILKEREPKTKFVPTLFKRRPFFTPYAACASHTKPRTHSNCSERQLRQESYLTIANPCWQYFGGGIVSFCGLPRYAATLYYPF
jgi:hypothetical protein